MDSHAPARLRLAGGALGAVLAASAVTSGASADDGAFRLEATATPVLLASLGQVDDAVEAGAVGADDEEARLAETLAVTERVRARFGEAGTGRFEIHAGYGYDVKDDNWVAQGGVAFNEFVEDGVAIRVEVNGLHVNQINGDAQGINVNLMFQWHFMRRETWSIYADAGVGMLYTTDDVPFNGSSFNFTPQAGFGATFDVADDVRAVLGLRWHHISNANTFEENPGRDHIMFFGGLSFPF